MKYLFIKCSNPGELSERSSIGRYFVRLILFSFPFILLFGTYFIWDPFKVIYNYDQYYQNNDYFINKNRDFISTEMYLKNYRKFNYDSFILGSSTSLFFLPSSWKEHIDSPCSIFSFDASGENIVGIWSKIKFIHKKNNQIKHALIVFDTGGTFSQFKNEGHIFKKHYKVYPSSKYAFHYDSFMSYLNFKFLIAFVQFKISHRFYPYMNDVLEERNYSFDLVTNEIIFTGPAQELKMDSIGYYKARSGMFFTRTNIPAESIPMINEKHIQMLKEIRDIFAEDKTDYRIIVSPLYEQISFNKQDLRILKELFGNTKVFDFSGINKYTAEISHYYDPHHFKPYMGNEILSEIFNHSH
jgi:hypothetical protein